MNRNKPSKQPPASYVEGKLRDPEIEEKQDQDFAARDLERLLRRSVDKKKPPEGAAPNKSRGYQRIPAR